MRDAADSRHLRFRVNATRCDGQGVCALVAPEIFRLDRYGHAYVTADWPAADAEIRARGLDAEAACPRNAVFVEPARPALGPARPPREPARPDPTALVPAAAVPPRLLTDAPEPGWPDRFPADIFPADIARAADIAQVVSDAGVFGQGGAAFPAAVKWQFLGAGARVLVVNAAEREPGTVKDRYLLRMRPRLVLDGVTLACRATGAREVHVGIDEESDTEAAAFTRALAGARLPGISVTVHRVPARYVAGEETALISFIESGRAVPWPRPPFPAQTGLGGRPTLVHNVETLAQIALAVRLGASGFRSAGTADAPGTGLFSVGRFGGPVTLIERPYGYPLRQLLADVHLTGIRGVLVGGYAGGLLAPDVLDVALTPAALDSLGASLGTKSVQVIGPDDCPVGVTAQILGYLAGQTAGQCPPCWRGLPDMAASIRQLEETGEVPLADVESYMRTLFDRGVCRLPDGAARVTLSLLRGFAGDVRRHADVGGCPYRQRGEAPRMTR